MRDSHSPKFWRDFPGGPVVKALPSNSGGAGSIPGWGAKIPHALRPNNQNIKQKQCSSKFNKVVKNGPHQKKNNNNKKEENLGNQTFGRQESAKHILGRRLTWPNQRLGFWD